jgi:hypothetical protein
MGGVGKERGGYFQQEIWGYPVVRKERRGKLEGGREVYSLGTGKRRGGRWKETYPLQLSSAALPLSVLVLCPMHTNSV